MELRSIRRMIQKITDSVPESGTLDFLGRNNFMTIPINKDPDTEYKNEFKLWINYKILLTNTPPICIIG